MNRIIIFLAVLVSGVYASTPSSQIRMVKMTGDDLRQKDMANQNTYATSLMAPKDAYLSFAKKGAVNAKMAKSKIFHQSIMGGMYVGFGGLLSFCVAGNLGGIAAKNPGLVKMMFAALFPVNLLFILTSGAQLFTGNSCAVIAAKYEGLVQWCDVRKSLIVSILGNAVGCLLFAWASSYIGLLSGGAGELLATIAVNKCSATFGQTLVKGILCNWLGCFAVFLAGASTDLAGKMIGIWFPVSTVVAIGLDHAIANMYILPAAMMRKVPLTMSDVIFKNLIPVIIGNAIAGAFVMAGSYSYQYGRLGKEIPKAIVKLFEFAADEVNQPDEKWGIFSAKRD